MVFLVVISLHAIGMGFLAGTACMINLRLLGVAPSVPLARLAAFLPVAWLALVVNAVSGMLLLIGYPTKALTNPVFYLKLIVMVVRCGACAGSASTCCSLMSRLSTRRHVILRR